MGLPIPTMMMPPQMVPMMMPPPGSKLIAAPHISSGPVIMAPPRPRVEKPIALYIGHLTSAVKDDFFKMLLGYCGHMKSWKRVTSSFGFVEYYSPDSALRAIRVLGGRTLLGKSILVNADKKTKELLDKYTEDVKQGKVRPLTHPGDDAIGKSGAQIMEDQDAVAKKLIQTLISSQAENLATKVEEESPSKSRSESRKRSKSPKRDKVLQSMSTSGSRLRSSSRKRSRSPSPSPSPSRSRERRRRSRHKRSRSRSKRSRSRSKRSRSRHRRKRRRKKRKKERRKRSRRSESVESEKSPKKEKRKETKEPEPDPNNLPDPGSSNAPKDAKQIVSYIPKDQKTLFEYTIDWELVEKNDLVEKVMRIWIDARIQEYLGEKEADLTNFAVGLLSHRIPPKDIISEMEMVLVEDAEGFVVKMWRRIIFESLKVKYKIS